VITAWALDLPSEHPTHLDMIDEYLDGYDFVVTITDIVPRKTGNGNRVRVKATFDKDVGTA
jgi:hypothetical protein